MKEFVYGKFKKEEKEAYRCFVKFAENNPKLCSDFYPEGYGCQHDVFGYNYTGGTEIIELKKRAEETSGYTTCFIEPEKLRYLQGQWESNSTMPMYVNFIGNEKNVYLWLIPQITDKKWYPKVFIDGEYVSRWGLYWNQAYHFTWNDKLNTYEVEKPKGNIRAFDKPVLKTEDIDYEALREKRIMNERDME